ncbi:MAG: WD40/YVTN/BNR-like repeat-containing protein [Planctomycetota bacterium]
MAASVQKIPSPLRGKYAGGALRYARNPWSMAFFDGKVFLGGGNSNNKGPAANAGPVPLFQIDAKTGKVVQEYEVKDEQIDVFRVLATGGAGELCIPGHDSKEPPITDWMYGNVYRRRAGGSGWEKLRTIKNGIHVYDVAFHEGVHFAAIANLLGAFVARSEDKGLTWHEMPAAVLPFNRARALLALGGELYASTNGPTGGARIYKWDGGKTMVHAKAAGFFPGCPATCFVARPTPIGAFSTANEVAYIAAKPLIDHDWEPQGLFVANASLGARKVALPGNATPRDLVFSSGKLHVLASTGTGPKTVVHIFVFSGAGGAATEVFRQETTTFARSFALTSAGHYYLGLGCEPNALHDDSGDLLRVELSG